METTSVKGMKTTIKRTKKPLVTGENFYLEYTSYTSQEFAATPATTINEMYSTGEKSTHIQFIINTMHTL